jgi:hypothetical protein
VQQATGPGPQYEQQQETSASGGLSRQQASPALAALSSYFAQQPQVSNHLKN